MKKDGGVDGKSDKCNVEKSSTSESDGKVHKQKIGQNLIFKGYC